MFRDNNQCIYNKNVLHFHDLLVLTCSARCVTLQFFIIKTLDKAIVQKFMFSFLQFKAIVETF